MFQLISDGGCDFTLQEIANHSIDIVPFYVSFDQQNYLKEGVDITREDFFHRLISDKSLFPKTAQPNPQDYMDVAIPYLDQGQDVIFVTISSKVSGSYNSAMLASNLLKESHPARSIYVIDSLNGSIGQGLILKELLAMKAVGIDTAQAVKIAQKIVPTVKTYFSVDSLEYLRRGGRIGPTTAFVGSLLGLRPILQLEDGAISQLDNVRGKKKARAMIEEAVVEVLREEAAHINVAIAHILSPEDAAEFKGNIETAIGASILNPIAEVCPAIGAHVGPGALVLSYCQKYTSFGGAFLNAIG